MAYYTQSATYMTPDSGPFLYNPSDLSSNEGWPSIYFKGTHYSKIRAKVSPSALYFAKDKDYILRYVINQTVDSYARTNNTIRVRPITGESYIPTNGTISTTKNSTTTAFDRPGWTLSQNSWISEYTYDNNGNLSIEISTADYDIQYIQPLLYSTTDSDWTVNFTPSKKDVLQSKLRKNLIIISKSRGSSLGICDIPEQKALETLRERITEKDFKKYLRYGFILVPGKSGATYQVFRNNWHTKVWKGGKLIEEVCVHIKTDHRCPPTDNVIALMTAISSDENEFKKLGNVYRMAA